VIDGLVQVPGIGKVEYIEIVLSILNMLKNIVGDK
jgi:hypothetical protein